jgi:hypothetical protein
MRWTEYEKSVVRGAVAEASKHGKSFTTDQVWDRVEGLVPYSKGMGVLLQTMAAEGAIRQTGKVRRSARQGEHGHAQTLRVWRGRMFRGAVNV